MSAIQELPPLSWMANSEFTPPKDVVELLDRCVEWAEEERRWMCGAFMNKLQIGGEVADPVPVCQNVSACAMGIIVLCRWNGPAYESNKSYGEKGLEINGKYHIVNERVVAFDEMAALATRYVAAHLPDQYTGRVSVSNGERLYKERTPAEQTRWAFTKGRPINDIVQKITSFNDKAPEDASDYLLHHKKIVKCFKEAREHAKRDLEATSA